MFGLGGQVDGDGHGVGRIVRDDGGFRWPGEDVDPDPSEEEPFCLRHVGIAGADDDVRLAAGEKAESQARHGLDSTHFEYGVGTGQVHGVSHGRVDRVSARRRAGDDEVDAGDLGRGHAHDGRGRVGIAAAGHIAAGALYRHHPLAETHTRRGLDLEFPQALLLRLGEAAHLLVREA